MNAWLAKPIPLSLVYCDPALLFATPFLMQIKSSARSACLICEDFMLPLRPGRRDDRPL